MKTRILTLGLALALAGCAQPASHVAPASVAPAATVSMVATLDIRDTSDRQVLAVLEPWKKADIDHVKLSLYEGATLVATATVEEADLSKTVRFTSLRMNTSYTVQAQAWSDAAEASRIDNAVADAASCTTHFSTTTDELVNVGTIKLELKDKTFSGTGTSSGPIDVTDGGLVDTTASTAIEVGS